VLAAWAASPSRFREDANAEEDAVRGGYRDRLGVELLQNAVDAARVAGVPARVLLRMRRGPHAGLLECANTGAALSAPGIEALSTLRASAKRGDDASVGRFGVGFAAVLAVSDAPSVVSRLGPGDQASCVGVAWSAEATRDLVEAVPELAGELAARGGCRSRSRRRNRRRPATTPSSGCRCATRAPRRPCSTGWTPPSRSCCPGWPS